MDEQNCVQTWKVLCKKEGVMILADKESSLLQILPSLKATLEPKIIRSEIGDILNSKREFPTEYYLQITFICANSTIFDLVSI